uniref:F-box domain-containing protein n=1 Tax=Eutreptiella gymnastica TaxID=73025 RepID=A0A7S1IM19_9EUGL|mmetsp:Transcript_27578/g.49693  ORF Transcript_27578/g.49693 Transcript_27578/m.49693 type:complete len:418 (+) Transcript_27578:96-1349(+)
MSHNTEFRAALPCSLPRELWQHILTFLRSTVRYRTLSRGLHALIGLNVSCRRGMCDEDWAVVFGIAPKAVGLDLSGCALDQRRLSGISAAITGRGLSPSVVPHPPPKLVALKLNHCHLRDDELKLLGPVLQEVRTLRQLGLAGNRLTASGLADLLELVAGTSVTLLDISANSGAMSAVSLKALANAVLQNPALTELDLSHTRLERSELLQPLMTAIAKSGSFCALRLAGMAPGSKAVRMLADAIRGAGSFRNLALPDAKLSVHCLRTLTNAIAASQRFESLDVTQTSIGTDSAQVVADAIARTPSFVDLQATVLGSRPLHVLMEGVQRSQTFRRLVVRYTFLCLYGAQALAKTIRHCPSLRSVELARLPFGDPDAFAADTAVGWLKEEVATIRSPRDFHLRLVSIVFESPGAVCRLP